MKKYLLVLLFGLFLFSPAAWADNKQIDIREYTFLPGNLTIPVGTTVTWTNRDDEPHGVKESNDKFHSSALDTNESFSYTFTEPGTYTYFCTLHSYMKGTVTVTKAP